MLAVWMCGGGGGDQDIDQTFNLSVRLLPCDELLWPASCSAQDMRIPKIPSIRHCKKPCEITSHWGIDIGSL